MVVAVDAGGVAVVESELDGVVADGSGGSGFGFGLEHRESGGRNDRGWGCGLFIFFAAFVAASGAGAFFAQVGKIVVAGVAVGPDDVDAGPGGDVDFHAGGFFPGINGDGHGSYSRQFTVEGGKKGNRESKDSPLHFYARFATIARRDGIAVRASLGVAEEGADALVEFGADDVFELAGLRLRFGIFDGESVLEEALGEAMAADYIAGAAAAGGSELHFAVLQLQ